MKTLVKELRYVAKTLETRAAGFEMTSKPPKSLKEVAQQNNYNKHGEYFSMEFDDGYDTMYFYPVLIQKNGGLKGVMFMAYGGSFAGKAKYDSVSKMDFGRWRHISKKEVPKKVVDKMDDKIKLLYDKAAKE